MPGARVRQPAAGEEHIAEPAQVRAHGPAVHPGNVSEPRVPPHATCPASRRVSAARHRHRVRVEPARAQRGRDGGARRGDSGHPRRGRAGPTQRLRRL